jgi:hypothetical protein
VRSQIPTLLNTFQGTLAYGQTGLTEKLHGKMHAAHQILSFAMQGHHKIQIVLKRSV